MVKKSHVRGQFSEMFNIHHAHSVVVAVVVTNACVCTNIFVHRQSTFRGHPVHAHNAGAKGEAQKTAQTTTQRGAQTSSSAL